MIAEQNDGSNMIAAPVLAFAQGLSDMKTFSNSTLQEMLAEMGIIRNGISSNNTDLTEFKRNKATVQHQMQSQISDLRDKLSDAYAEIANMKKITSHFEQDVHTEYESLLKGVEYKTIELEAMKKTYAQTHQQLREQIMQLQKEILDIRTKSEDSFRQGAIANEENGNKITEVQMAAQYANSEINRLRNDRERDFAMVGENMNHWNLSLRELSKEFYGYQKQIHVNQLKLQNNVWDLQKGCAAVEYQQTNITTKEDTNNQDARLGKKRLSDHSSATPPSRIWRSIGLQQQLQQQQQQKEQQQQPQQQPQPQQQQQQQQQQEHRRDSQPLALSAWMADNSRRSFFSMFPPPHPFQKSNQENAQFAPPFADYASSVEHRNKRLMEESAVTYVPSRECPMPTAEQRISMQRPIEKEVVI